MKTAKPIPEEIADIYFVPCGDKYGIIRISAGWIDENGVAKVNGAIYGPSNKLVCTFENSLIASSWIPALKTYILENTKCPQ